MIEFLNGNLVITIFTMYWRLKYFLVMDEAKASPEPANSKPESNSKENSMSSRIESLTIQEDVKEGEAEDEEGLPIYPYERLKITSTDPITEIDVTKREV